MPLEFDHKLAMAAIIAVAMVVTAVYAFLVPKAPPVDDSDRARFTCIFLCKAALNEGQNLERGPCLSSGSPAWEVDGWACDIAHSPRELVDNDPANQCQEFGRSAGHFVELDPQCGLIRIV